MAGVGIDEVAAAIERYAPDVLDATRTPGAVLAIGDRAGKIIEFACGYANVEEAAPMEPSHVIQVGSLAKLYVATAVMQLVELGEVDLHAPVNLYLPFQVRNPLGAQAVTLTHLLSHMSGLVTDTFDALLCEPEEKYLRGQIADPWAPSIESGGCDGPTLWASNTRTAATGSL